MASGARRRGGAAALEAAFVAHGRRAGLEEDLLAAVLAGRAEAGAGAGPSPFSPSGASAGSGESGETASVSIRSSLLDDSEDAVDPAGLGAGAAGGATAQRATATAQSLLEQLEAVRHEKRLLEVDYERVQALAASQLRDLARRHRAKVSELSAQLVSLPVLRERLESRRADFGRGASLDCPPALYERLSRCAEDELSVRELVLLRVFEVSAGLRARCEAAEREAASARAAAAAAAERRAEIEAQLTRLQQRGSAAAAALEQELAQAKGEARESKQKFLDSLRLSDGLHEQAALGARLKARVEELEREAGEARRRAEEAAAAAAAADASRHDAGDTVRRLQEQVELLKVDKAYLGRERDEARAAVKRADAAAERERERGHGLEERVERLRDQLGEVRERAKGEYEQRLAREVEALQAATSRQISELKELQLGAAEREARALRVAKEEASGEAAAARDRADAARREVDELRAELQAREQALVQQGSELRSQLSVRAFENEALSAAVDQRSAALRRAELQAEMLASKLDVLRNEFAALETTSARRAAELGARLATAEEKLQVYEALETEVDAALLDQARAKLDARSGHGPAGDADDSDDGALDALGEAAASAAGDDDDRAVAALVRAAARNAQRRQHDASAQGQGQGQNQVGENQRQAATTLLPVAAQRRVRHSVMLAERLVKAERTSEALRAELRELAAQLAAVRARAEALEREASTAAQPQSYLVSRLHEKDRLLAKLAEGLAAKEAELDAARRARAQAIEQRDGLHADLRSVLSERAVLERSVREQLEAAAAEREAAHDKTVLAAQVQAQTRQPPALSVRIPPSAALATSPVSAPIGQALSRGGRRAATVAQGPFSAPSPQGPGFTAQGSPHDGVELTGDTVEEVDGPDALNASFLSGTSRGSAAVFLLHEADEQGIPLPRWYRKLRQP